MSMMPLGPPISPSAERQMPSSALAGRVAPVFGGFEAREFERPGSVPGSALLSCHLTAPSFNDARGKLPMLRWRF